MAATWTKSLPIALISLIVPFACGGALSTWMYAVDQSAVAESGSPPVDKIAFALFVGTAFSFTAFPLLARILTSANLLGSPLGVQALSTAAIDDLLAWCSLAIALSLSRGGGVASGFIMLGIALTFVILEVMACAGCFGLVLCWLCGHYGWGWCSGVMSGAGAGDGRAMDTGVVS